MTEQTMTPDDVLAALKSVVRIAKAASVGVTGNGPRIEKAEQAIAAVAALIARNAELEANNKALRVAAECYKAISTTPIAYDVLKRHGLTALESPYNFCNRMNAEALARAEAG